MTRKTELARLRAEIARTTKLTRRHPQDAALREKLIAVRGEYAEKRIAYYVEDVVAAAPELTPAQSDRLSLLLRPLSAGVKQATHA